MNGGRIVLLAVAVLVVLAAVSKLNHHSGHRLTNAEIKAQVGRLADRQDGTNLTLQSVPWCVQGMSDGEWECGVNELNHALNQRWQVTVWAKCNATTCRLEKT